MTSKRVRLYVVGEGDAELQSLIRQGLSELGQGCEQTVVGSDCCALLDTLANDEIPVIIKPFNGGL